MTTGRYAKYGGRACWGVVLLVLVACQPPPSPGLIPLEQPAELQAAPPRISGEIAPDRGRQRAFEDRGAPAQPATAGPPPPALGTTQSGDVTLNFVDADIREIARAILGATLKLNYTIDPNVRGTGSIETGTPLPRSALLPTLETVLNQNGATLVERNGIYSIVPIAAGAAANPIAGGNGLGAGAEVVPLRYASARDLAKMLEPFVAEGGKITADPAHNALLVSGTAAVRTTLVGLIRAFDIDALAGQSYGLFPAGGGEPGKLAAQFEKVLQAQTEGPLAGIVRVLPMDRVNAVLVVSSQPRYIDAANRFFRLASRVEDATARSWHVYYVQNGLSTDLENLLQRAFTPGHVSPTPAPGSTAPGAAQVSLSTGLPGQGGGALGTSGQGAASGAGGAATGGAGATGGLGFGSGRRACCRRDPDPGHRAAIERSAGRRRREPHPHHRQSPQQRAFDLCNAERILGNRRHAPQN